MLDPQAQALMNLMIDKGLPPVHTQTPTEARASYRARRSFTQPDAPEVGRVQDLSFQHSGVDIAVRVYHPAAASPALPALVYLHGADGIFPKLEAELAGKTVGDAVKLELAPEDAFGEYDAELVRMEPVDLFPESVAVGMQFDFPGER